MPEIVCGGRRVGPGHPCFVIAEIGTNHGGSLEKAKALVAASAEAGADAAKFQIYEADDIVSRDILPEDYGLEGLYSGRTMHEVFDRQLRTPRQWFPELADHARSLGLLPMATAHSGSGAEFIAGQGMAAIKIASMDLNNLPVLDEVAEAAAAARVPVIFSTGLAELCEVDEAARLFERRGCDYAILHCVANYPPDFDELHLNNIRVLAAAYDVPVGFSDHTPTGSTAAVAVALGASIIEKHLTLSRREVGPDHPFALEPGDFRKLVEDIRAVEAAYDPDAGFRGPSPREREKRDVYRRSLVARRHIPAGTVLTKEDVKLTRPGTGIPPKFLAEVLGRAAREDIPAERPIEWGMV